MCQEFCPREEAAWWGVCMAGGACMAGGVSGRGGGMHGKGGVCMAGGYAWQGACMAGGVCGRGSMHGSGGHAWHACPPQQILRDMVNEWAVHILLECILVNKNELTFKSTKHIAVNIGDQIQYSLQRNLKSDF